MIKETLMTICAITVDLTSALLNRIQTHLLKNSLDDRPHWLVHLVAHQIAHNRPLARVSPFQAKSISEWKISATLAKIIQMNTTMDHLSRRRVVMAVVISGRADRHTFSLLSVLLIIKMVVAMTMMMVMMMTMIMSILDLSLARARTRMLHSACLKEMVSMISCSNGNLGKVDII